MRKPDFVAWNNIGTDQPEHPQSSQHLCYWLKVKYESNNNR